MAKIYFLEKAEPQKTFQTQQGMCTSQKITLRDLDGNSQYAERVSVEYLGNDDLSRYQGMLVAAHVTKSFKRKENGDFSTLICREVVGIYEAQVQ